jgi:hypothetical protein
MGHRDLLVTQIYLSLPATNAPSASREAFAARAASSKSDYRKVAAHANASFRESFIGSVTDGLRLAGKFGALGRAQGV